MKLKRDCGRIIRFELWQLTVSQPAYGSCSITCRWSSTCFIETNALFTAWRIFGATRHCSNGKRLQCVDVRGLVRGERRSCSSVVAERRSDYLGDVLGDVRPERRPGNCESEAAYFLPLHRNSWLRHLDFDGADVGGGSLRSSHPALVAPRRRTDVADIDRRASSHR